jgi:hypothetical protein
MNYTTIILILCAMLAVPLVFAGVIPRFRMARRARALLAQYPDAEQTSVYLELHSPWAWSKRLEIDAKIAQMRPQGWTFLRAMEANPLRTVRSLGGGLTLYFIRTTA